MSETKNGRVWKFGDNISTDLMYPSTVMHNKVPDDERKWACMSANRPEFARSVEPNDIIVAGRNFGCGSSRPASHLLKELQIGCILADSFSAIFYRNCIGAGVPAIELPEIGEMFLDGDRGDVDLSSGIVKNLSSGEIRTFAPFPNEIIEILNVGGMIEFIRRDFELSGSKNSKGE
ncbi:MAG: hypothetical protein LBQ58_10545 [Synergistaceae bacterium]|jgi:3-isopropylmalate/(R)-2-methylmalate dehydratase small subunit|nr:hypothetical protein [Synergistaceae bacterium]